MTPELVDVGSFECSKGLSVPRCGPFPSVLLVSDERDRSWDEYLLFVVRSSSHGDRNG